MKISPEETGAIVGLSMAAGIGGPLAWSEILVIFVISLALRCLFYFVFGEKK